MNPIYPIYVISKGRWESRLTVKALEERHIPYHVVIEPQEYEKYAAVIHPDKIYTLPFSNLGQGSIPARNWVWEHSKAAGHKRHWILDDNIRHFYRLYKNMRYYTTDGTGFRAIEKFVDRYLNIYISGMNYRMFAPSNQVRPPLMFNTRVYSCILIDNSIEHRWRGRYNEDTDLCLRVLKDGGCTALFYAFLADKMATMKMKGGNTDSLYKQDAQFDGRLEMARSLVRQHPDVATITWKWGRWQHLVDYSKFKHNKLILRPDAEIPEGIDEMGMRCVNRAAAQ